MNKLTPPLFAAALLALLLPVTALAEDDAQQEPLVFEAPPLVITGSHYKANSFNLPFSVQRIEAEQATEAKPMSISPRRWAAFPAWWCRIATITPRTCRFPRAVLAHARPSGFAASN